MAARHNKAVSLILLLHTCAILRRLKYTSLIRTRRDPSEWASHRCRRLFPPSRTPFFQQVEHGLGGCRFGQSNSNRAPPNGSGCRHLEGFFGIFYLSKTAGEGNRTPV